MYTPVIITEGYRIVRRGETCEGLDDAKKAARELPIETRQVFAVVDANNIIHWRGGTMKASAVRSKKDSSMEKA